MKIIHTSDWHLGRIIYGKSLLEDQRYFIEKYFYGVLDAEKPDAVIIAGDLFDRQIAPVESLRLFDAFVTEVCGKRGIPLIAVSGNHDGADRLGLGQQLLGAGGFHITSRLDASVKPFVLHGERDVHIYSLPYFDPAMARDVMQDEEIRGFSRAYEAVLENIKQNLDRSAFNILVAHCFAAGAEQSDSESPLFIGGSGEVEANVFNGFDYVALGHLHRAQNIGSNLRYSGSPVKYSFDEQNHKKSLTVLEIGETFEKRIIPVMPMRDMRVINGNINEIESAAKTDENSNDYIFAELEGAPVFEPMHRLRKSYPNTLGVRNGSEFSESVGEKSARSGLKRSDPAVIFDEFLRQMCGSEPSEDDRAVFAAAFEQSAGRESK